MNPETFAQQGIPAHSVESTNPHTGARYTAPGLWGAELFVLQLVAVTPERPGPWPVTHLPGLGYPGGQHHPTTTGEQTHPPGDP